MDSCVHGSQLCSHAFILVTCLNVYQTFSDFAESSILATLHTNRRLQHKEAYGIGHVRPKFHWIFDIVRQFRRDEMVHDQFIIERLHLRIKKPGEKIDNLRRWEGSVLAEALNHQIQDLRLLKGPCHVLDNRCTHLDEFPNACLLYTSPSPRD